MHKPATSGLTILTFSWKTQYLLNGVGDGDQDEPIFWIEIILAAFIDDSDVAVLFASGTDDDKL